MAVTVGHGVSGDNNSETLAKFSSWVEDGEARSTRMKIVAWAKHAPQPYDRDAYQGLYQDPTRTSVEPHVKFI